MPRAELQMVLWNGLTKLQLQHLREQRIPSLGSPSFFLFSEVLIYISSVWENSQLPRISWAQRFEKEHIGPYLLNQLWKQRHVVWTWLFPLSLGLGHWRGDWGRDESLSIKKHCELNMGMCPASPHTDVTSFAFSTSSFSLCTPCSCCNPLSSRLSDLPCSLIHTHALSKVLCPGMNLPVSDLFYQGSCLTLCNLKQLVWLLQHCKLVHGPSGMTLFQRHFWI